MTKEELEKEADDYAEKHAFRVPYDGSNKFYDDVDFKASKEGYLAAAEPREKQIEELKKLCQEKDISNDDLTRRLVDFSDKYYILLEVCHSLQDYIASITDFEG